MLGKYAVLHCPASITNGRSTAQKSSDVKFNSPMMISMMMLKNASVFFADRMIDGYRFTHASSISSMMLFE